MAKKPQEGIQFTKEPYIEDIGPRKTKSIRFSMLSESDIYKAAEVQVFKGVYYDMTKKPIPNGLLDPRMVVFGIVGLKGMDWTSLIQGICKSKDPY